MTDQIREQMSALLDGELSRDEMSLLVRRMARDTELKRAFGSYVTAGEALRAPGGVLASAGFAARVGAAIDAEEGIAVMPVAEMPAEVVRSSRWRRPAAAAAVAASAALAAVLLVRPDGGSPNVFASRSGAPALAPVAALPVGGASPTPAANQRLAGYLMVHGQYATPIGRRAAWSNALATDPGIARVTYEPAEAR
jgi:sigma-E factor negative regulatory protein RseA